MNEIKNLRSKARKLSRKSYGKMISRLASYGVHVDEFCSSNLSHYDIVLPFELEHSSVKRAYYIANAVLDTIEYDGVSFFLMEIESTNYLCIKFWKEIF